MGFNEDVYAEMGEILDGDFSQSVLIEIGAHSATLTCIFSKTYLEVNPQGVPIQTNSPIFGIDKTAADAALGTELTADGTTNFATVAGIKYRIKRVEADGTGFAVVYLKNYVP